MGDEIVLFPFILKDCRQVIKHYKTGTKIVNNVAMKADNSRPDLSDFLYNEYK